MPVHDDRWMQPTLQHELHARKAGVHVSTLSRVRTEEMDNPAARCPCGRRTTADMLVDLRSLPPGYLSKCGIAAAWDFACDACRGRWYTLGLVDRVDMARQLGAPEAVLARIRVEQRRGKFI